MLKADLIQGVPLYRIHEKDAKPHHEAIVREANQAGLNSLPFSAHGKDWFVTRLDVEDGVLIIDGIEFDEFIATNGVPRPPP